MQDRVAGRGIRRGRGDWREKAGGEVKTLVQESRIWTLLELSQLLQSAAVRISSCSPSTNEDNYTRTIYTFSVSLYRETSNSEWQDAWRSLKTFTYAHISHIYHQHTQQTITAISAHSKQWRWSVKTEIYRRGARNTQDKQETKLKRQKRKNETFPQSVLCCCLGRREGGRECCCWL